MISKVKLYPRVYIEYSYLIGRYVFIAFGTAFEKRLHLGKFVFWYSYPGIRNIVLHLDNDRPGHLASEALRTVICSPYNVRDAPPPFAKDCNEYLLYKLGKEKNRTEWNDAR